MVGSTAHGTPRRTTSAFRLLKIDTRSKPEQLAGLRALDRRSDEPAPCQRGPGRAGGGACAGSDNLMPRILEAVKAYATVGEICATLKTVFGEYREEKPVL